MIGLSALDHVGISISLPTNTGFFRNTLAGTFRGNANLSPLPPSKATLQGDFKGIRPQTQIFPISLSGVSQYSSTQSLPGFLRPDFSNSPPSLSGGVHSSGPLISNSTLYGNMVPRGMDSTLTHRNHSEPTPLNSNRTIPPIPPIKPSPLSYRTSMLSEKNAHVISSFAPGMKSNKSLEMSGNQSGMFKSVYGASYSSLVTNNLPKDTSPPQAYSKSDSKSNSYLNTSHVPGLSDKTGGSIQSSQIESSLDSLSPYSLISPSEVTSSHASISKGSFADAIAKRALEKQGISLSLTGLVSPTPSPKSFLSSDPPPPPPPPSLLPPSSLPLPFLSPEIIKKEADSEPIPSPKVPRKKEGNQIFSFAFFMLGEEIISFQ